VPEKVQFFISCIERYNFVTPVTIVLQFILSFIRLTSALSASRLLENNLHTTSRFENEEDDIGDEVRSAGFFSAVTWSHILPSQLPSLTSLLQQNKSNVKNKR
jgi:hypothetical protein